MAYSQIVQDINTAVHHAIADGLYELGETDLIERADALLATLPIAGGAEPTTVLLLRHYHMQLQAELCHGRRPWAQFDTVEGELRELTRGVMATMGGDEGISVETAVLIALVLHVHGIAKFCALPAGMPIGS